MKQCVFCHFNFFPISVRHVLILTRLTLKIHSQPVSFTFHNFWFPNRAPITDKLFSQSTRNHCFSYGSAISICLLSPIEYKTYFDFSFWSQYTFIQRLISVCSFSSQKNHNFWFPNMAAVRQATLHFLSFNEKPALFAWQCFSTSVWPVVSRERWAGMLLPVAPGHYWLLPAWSPLSLLLPNAAHSANNKPGNWEVLLRSYLNWMHLKVPENNCTYWHVALHCVKHVLVETSMLNCFA